MPSRNISKIDVAESYYHVYARGISKSEIFLDAKDYAYFEKLLERYLSAEQAISKQGFVYPNYFGKVELLTYCLMPNHFHMLLYQVDAGSMSKLMRSLMTSFSRYINLRYKRSGPVFESTYKASLIGNQAYLEHISRYIHLNPRYWKNYPYSSLKYYQDTHQVTWLKPAKVLELFTNFEAYQIFLEDYEDRKMILKEIKHALAN